MAEVQTVVQVTPAPRPLPVSQTPAQPVHGFIVCERFAAEDPCFKAWCPTHAAAEEYIRKYGTKYWDIV